MTDAEQSARQPHQDESGDWVCEHGAAMDVHCCDCRRRGFFPPDDCDCYDDPQDVENTDA